MAFIWYIIENLFRKHCYLPEIARFYVRVMRKFGKLLSEQKFPIKSKNLVPAGDAGDTKTTDNTVEIQTVNENYLKSCQVSQ
jgi:hypothetical protein